jgi:NAD/NADP transhydrogenase alpha subunit
MDAGYLLKSFFFTNFPSQNNFRSDIVLKVRQPSIEEAAKFKEGGTLYSFLYPAQNKELIDEMAKYKLTAFGMDCVPRISRAQVFDALSSMGNISGMRFDEIFQIMIRFRRALFHF